MSPSTVRQIVQRTVQSTSKQVDSAAFSPRNNCVTPFQAFPVTNPCVSMGCADLP